MNATGQAGANHQREETADMNGADAPSSETQEAAIVRLAGLDDLKYAQCRKAEATKLGIGVVELDNLRKAAIAAVKQTKAQRARERRHERQSKTGRQQ